MDVHFLLMRCLFTIHITCLHIPSAESSMRLRTGWTSTSPPPPATTHTGRQLPIPPEGRPESPSVAGAAQGTDTGPFYGGFGGFSRRKTRKRGHVRGFGRFNSDTRGCRGIETKLCSSPSHCSGCLGLYTCTVSLGKCQLKGLSQQTDKFLQTLKDV